MGNRQGHQKEQTKSKADKKREKDDEKARKQKESKERKDRKKRLGHTNTAAALELDTDFDESSHVTGGDSESCVFHSAENVSISPYLDSSTRSEHEQNASSIFRNIPTTSQTSQILSSRDFQDGFSLEACLPPEIARMEKSDNQHPCQKTGRSVFTGSVMSRSDPDVDFRSPSTGAGHTPYHLTSQASVPTNTQKHDRSNSLRVHESPSDRGFHHPHFYNHHHSPRPHHHLLNHLDAQNQNKPSSPQPKRRAFSLKKATTASFKSTSSDDSSSTPSSTVPTRRATNFLALLKPSSKSERADKQAAAAMEKSPFNRSNSVADESPARSKSKPLWKTWERSRSKKREKEQRISIFGTARKSDQKPCQLEARKQDTGLTGQANDVKIPEKVSGKSDNSKEVSEDKLAKQFSDVGQAQKTSKILTSNNTNSHHSSQNRTDNVTESGYNIRETSPSLSTTAAICILKLEELERSIEKTIREKFPDAEPFLLKKRSREELRGSRSLPTTPSLQKKQYVVWKEEVNPDRSRLSDEKSATRFYDETFESPPSPAKSPVILRRFGARTRHASISPKIARAKTAALYNSPSEISGTSSHFCSSISTSMPVHKKIQTQNPQPSSLSCRFIAPLSASQKSQSKYDNVSEDSDCIHPSHQIYNKTQSNNFGTVQADDSRKCLERDSEMVIIPSSSAVFGSVSPKLKRPFHVKFTESPYKEDSKPSKTQSVESEHRIYYDKTKDDRKVTMDEHSPRVKTGHRDEEITRNNLRQENPCLVQGGKETAPVFGKSINRLTSEKKVPVPGDDVMECVTNSDIKVEPDLHTSGQPPRVSERNLVSVGFRQPSDSVVGSSSPTQQHGACSAELASKSRNVTSPGTRREYSTHHAMLDVVRTSSPPPLSQVTPEKDAIRVSKPNTEHAQDMTSSNRDFRNTNKPQSTVALSSVLDPRSSTFVPDREVSKSDVTNASIKENQSDAANTGQHIVTESQHSSSQSSRNENQFHFGTSNDCSKNVKSYSAEDNALSETRFPSSISKCSENKHADDKSQTQLQNHQKQTEKQDSKQNQEKETISVLRQPVSEVISQMISLSKRQPSQTAEEEQNLQENRSRTASSEYGMEHLKPVVAVVTTPTYEQSCRTLEEKPVLRTPPAPTAVPETGYFTPVEYTSRCQEIQTDSYITADKSVDSDDLKETLAHRETQDFGQSPNAAGLRTMYSRTTETEEERRFFKRVLQGKKAQRRKGTEDKTSTELVPPPSPTAISQLVEEFMEEVEESDEDYDNDEKILTATILKRDKEMKDFTDIIYKRLSDLLDDQSTDDDNLDNDDVFVEDDSNVDVSREELASNTLEDDRNSIISSEDDSLTKISQKPTGLTSSLVKVLTIETSSSLTTTTSSDSDVDEPTQTFQNFQNMESNPGLDLKRAEDFHAERSPEYEFIFREIDVNKVVGAGESGQKSGARDYHSDDDVTTGRGIPEYYDDRTLWSRRQKPPGKMSATMQAIRTRERRERWLKKRRRNKTDLLSTGSSDTCSEFSQAGDCFHMRENSSSFDHGFHENHQSHKTDLGSGILTSPKYSKPILPFFGSKTSVDESKHKISHKNDSECTTQLLTHRKKRRSIESNSDEFDRNKIDDGQVFRNELKIDNKQVSVNDRCVEDSDNGNTPNPVSTKSDITAPSIEDTFLELQSVQNILVEMQNWQPAAQDNCQKQFMPLTKENVKSIREYYKDSYTSGSGRRSRMSIADRTESDLDLCSEARDDASSDSNLYADDEEDDDGQEPYATAEDDPGATAGGNCSTDSTSRRHGGGSVMEDDDDSDTNIVRTCTFYNSNTHPQNSTEASAKTQPVTATAEAKRTLRSTSSAPRAILDSDEEFWAGDATVDESYRQLETAADAVSSTFQNAREQMHDIQYHLQALRRQMEVMHEDLTTTSMTMTPNTSLESTGK